MASHPRNQTLNHDKYCAEIMQRESTASLCLESHGGSAQHAQSAYRCSASSHSIATQRQTLSWMILTASTQTSKQICYPHGRLLRCI